MEADEIPTGIQGMLSIAEQARATAEKYPQDVREFVHAMSLERELICSSKTRVKGFRHESYQDMVLELGSVKKAALELPEWCPAMEAQQCFHNAYELATADPSLTYVEGYALHSFFPVAHAWVEDESGRVIDPTWAGLDSQQTHAWYAGIKFGTKFLMERAIETGWLSIFGRDWERDAEILRLGFMMDEGLAIGMGEL